MGLMANRRSNVVAVPVREQSEIFESRRKQRRERINSVHAEVRAILQTDSKDEHKISVIETSFRKIK